MSYEPLVIEISWFLFIGCCLLGFPEKEVWKMTINKINTLYDYYKINYDFKLCRKTYREVEENRKKAMDGELTPD